MSHSDSQVIKDLAAEEAVAEAEAKASTQKRKKLFGALVGVILVAGLGYAAYWHFIGSRYVSTDNAYTAVEISQLTPAINGIVADVKVVDTQAVKKGQVLVVIDDSDAKLALAQAEADLGRAQRRVQGYFANDSGDRKSVV